MGCYMTLKWFYKESKSQLIQLLEILLVVFIIRTFFMGLYVVPSGSMETTMLVGERFFADKLTPWITPIQRGEIVSFNDPTYPYSSNKLVNLFQNYVWGPTNWTKRVIAIPGDHIQGVVENGVPVVYLNGRKLDEPYINQYPLIYCWSDKVPTVSELYNAYMLLSTDSCSVFPFKWNYRSFDPSMGYDKQPFYCIDKDLIIKKDVIHPSDASYSEEYGAYVGLPHTPLANCDVYDVILGPNEYWLMGDNRKGSADSRTYGKFSGSLIHGRIKFCFFSIQYTKPWSWKTIPGLSWLPIDESWVVIDLLLHPIDFWKRIRWNRCFRFIH